MKTSESLYSEANLEKPEKKPLLYLSGQLSIGSMARDRGKAKKRKWGMFVQGGYHTILNAAEKRISAMGITIRKAEPVQEINSASPYSIVTEKANTSSIRPC